MISNVKAYKDSDLLGRIEELGGAIPNYGKLLIIGVQSIEDSPNIFDDKFYVFHGPQFKMVSTGTTNAGRTALKHFDEYGLSGAAVWKTDMIYPDLYVNGLHKGRMKALRQNKPIYFYRDSNKNDLSEEIGPLYYDIIYANMHGVSYDPFSNVIRGKINSWSFACQVWNRMSDYRLMIEAARRIGKPVDYAILKEF